MKNALILFVLAMGVQVVSAQEKNASENAALSPANVSLLQKLVASDHQQSVSTLSAIHNNATKKNVTAKNQSSNLLLNSNMKINKESNVQVFVIKDSKSKVVKTNPQPNKAVTKQQQASLEAVLGIRN
ncbi:MAG: hypothetical protein KTR22_14260 [Flavobacteriaceae bacterium]|nr:hypothetical protein [Flavobacteriaceae bacterium]